MLDCTFKTTYVFFSLPVTKVLELKASSTALLPLATDNRPEDRKEKCHPWNGSVFSFSCFFLKLNFVQKGLEMCLTTYVRVYTSTVMECFISC